jgi:hypothetical protein
MQRLGLNLNTGHCQTGFFGVFFTFAFLEFVFALLTKQAFHGQLNKQSLAFSVELLKRSFGFNKDSIDGFFF